MPSKNVDQWDAPANLFMFKGSLSWDLLQGPEHNTTRSHTFSSSSDKICLKDKSTLFTFLLGYKMSKHSSSFSKIYTF